MPRWPNWLKASRAHGLHVPITVPSAIVSAVNRAVRTSGSASDISSLVRRAASDSTSIGLSSVQAVLGDVDRVVTVLVPQQARGICREHLIDQESGHRSSPSRS